MKKYTYLGKVRENTEPLKLIYLSTGKVENGLIKVIHYSSGDHKYHTLQEFNKLYKLI